MRQIFASMGLGILLIAVLAAYIFVVYAINKDPAYSDFGKFYQSAQLFWEGKSIYQPSIVKCFDNHINPPQYKEFFLSGNLNAPFFTFLILPLSLINYVHAITLWQILSLTAGLVSVIALRRIFHIGPWYKPAALALTIAILGYFPSYLNLQSCQVGLMMLLTTIGMWHCSRHGYDKAAGVLLGLLISIKVFYGLFLLFFLLHRRWRALLWTVLTTLFCSGLAVIIFGQEAYNQYYQILQNIYWYSSSWNGSLWGFLVRLFGYHEKNIPLLAVPGLAKIVYYSCAAYLLFIYTKIINRRSAGSQLQQFDVNFSLTLVLMLLLSPLGWAYYFPLLVIPFLVLWYLQSAYSKMHILIFLSGIVLLMSGIPTLLKQPWQMTSPLIVLSVGSYYFYALLLLFGVLCWVKCLFIHVEKDPVLRCATYGLPQFWVMVFYAMALLPSLVGVLGVSLNQKMHSDSYIKPNIVECN